MHLEICFIYAGRVLNIDNVKQNVYTYTYMYACVCSLVIYCANRMKMRVTWFLILLINGLLYFAFTLIQR